MFQLFDSVESLKLDIYPRERIPGELGRSRDVEIFSDVWLPIVSRVDAAASKLIWINHGSHKSRRDLRHIMLSANPDELEHLQDFANETGLAKLLTDVLAESDEIVE